MDLDKLKSGSDFRGTALADGGNEVDFTVAAVEALTKAFAAFLAKKQARDFSLAPLKIAVGHDSRLSAPIIYEAVKEALKQCGVWVYLCSLASTPSMFMMTKYEHTQCDGSIMITASHHPFDKNGLKFFSKDGGLNHSEIDEVLQLAKCGESVSFGGFKVVKKDFIADYCKVLVDKVRAETGDSLPLRGLRIIVDAGNGAGGFYEKLVLAPLGANTVGSQFTEPDGRFLNHVPNPEDRAAMQSICDAVRRVNADLGIIFDTDVDRAAIVGRGGVPINRSKLIALTAATVLSDGRGGTIVTDSVTSEALTGFIESRGGVHLRFKRGYNNVISKARELNDSGVYAPVAIETSGHAALKENYFLDDGAYLATMLLITLAKLKSFDALLDGYADPIEEGEARISITAEDFKPVAELIMKFIEIYSRDNFVLVPSFEGVRAKILRLDAVFTIRLSVHDPVIAVNIESNQSGGVSAAASELKMLLSRFDSLDFSGLDRLVK